MAVFSESGLRGLTLATAAGFVLGGAALLLALFWADMPRQVMTASPQTIT